MCVCILIYTLSNTTKNTLVKSKANHPHESLDVLSNFQVYEQYYIDIAYLSLHQSQPLSSSVLQEDYIAFTIPGGSLGLHVDPQGNEGTESEKKVCILPQSLRGGP